MDTSLIDLPCWTLSNRQLCDLECLQIGAFAPLTGFLNRDDYQFVVETMRLSNGQLWPMPIYLDISKSFAKNVNVGSEIVLCDDMGVMLAVMKVESIWSPDKKAEAQAVYQTTDTHHPGVNYLLHKTYDIYCGGSIRTLRMPTHYQFLANRRTPLQMQEHFKTIGWDRVAAFQTRNPMHRVHHDLTMNAMKQYNVNLLLHPVVGETMPGDIAMPVRVKCYDAILPYYDKDTVELNLLPLAMRMAGPREVLMYALIQANYGCTHFIVGRSPACPGNNTGENPFYPPFAAQELVKSYQEELPIEIIAFDELVYSAQRQAYLQKKDKHDEENVHEISGTELRRRLRFDENVPEWFSFPEVMNILKEAYPPNFKRGFTIFFTGLPSAGKSTLGNALRARLELLDRNVTLLDGDEVRKTLSGDLGFSKEDRDLNIERITYVAKEITRHRGVAICAQIAPYVKEREQARRLIQAEGGFFEIYVSTPLETCEARDIKGLYAKARQGIIKDFTGVNDKYEEPSKPDCSINMAESSVEEAVDSIINLLKRNFYIKE